MHLNLISLKLCNDKNRASFYMPETSSCLSSMQSLVFIICLLGEKKIKHAQKKTHKQKKAQTNKQKHPTYKFYCIIVSTARSSPINLESRDITFRNKWVRNRPSRTNSKERNKPYRIIHPVTIALTGKRIQLNDFRESPGLF